jgi:hypothetical protein
LVVVLGVAAGQSVVVLVVALVEDLVVVPGAAAEELVVVLPAWVLLVEELAVVLGVPMYLAATLVVVVVVALVVDRHENLVVVRPSPEHRGNLEGRRGSIWGHRGRQGMQAVHRLCLYPMMAVVGALLQCQERRYQPEPPGPS